MAAYEKMVLISENEYLELKGLKDYKTFDSKGTSTEKTYEPRPALYTTSPASTSSDPSPLSEDEPIEYDEPTPIPIIIENAAVDQYERVRGELGGKSALLEEDLEIEILQDFYPDVDNEDLLTVLGTVRGRVLERSMKHATVKQIVNETKDAIRETPQKKREIIEEMTGNIMKTLVPQRVFDSIRQEDIDDLNEIIKNVDKEGLPDMIDFADDLVREQEYLLALQTPAREEEVITVPDVDGEGRYKDRIEIAHQKFLELGVYDALNANVLSKYDDDDFNYEKFLRRVVSDSHARSKRQDDISVDLDDQDRIYYDAIQFFKKLCGKHPHLLSYVGDALRREFKKALKLKRLPKKKLPKLQALVRKKRSTPGKRLPSAEPAPSDSSMAYSVHSKKMGVLGRPPTPITSIRTPDWRAKREEPRKSTRSPKRKIIFDPTPQAWMRTSPATKARRRARAGLGMPQSESDDDDFIDVEKYKKRRT